MVETLTPYSKGKPGSKRLQSSNLSWSVADQYVHCNRVLERTMAILSRPAFSVRLIRKGGEIMKRWARAFFTFLAITGFVLVAFAASRLVVLNEPGGNEMGTWVGAVEVLAVQGDWAKVRMIGWVSKDQVAPAAPDGVRLEGSPGAGVWVSDVRIRRNFLGDAQVTGWVTNASGKDFDLLVIEAVLIDASGAVLDKMPIFISHIVDGATKGFSESTGISYEQVAQVVFQFSYGQ